ncbi:MAG: PAS domain-containing protein, partial [Pseudomonadota bacterium]
TQKKLQQSETSDLLNTIRQEYIMSITDVKGNIVDVNDAFCKISQYSRAELIGRSHRIINSGCHEPDFFKDMWNTILSGVSWHGEVCNRAKDGSIYWVDNVITPLHNADGKIERFVSIRTNITQKKLQQSETSDLLSTIHDQYIMSITDAKGTIIEVNDAFCAISKYEREELIGKNHRIINSGHHDTSFFEEIWSTILSGASWRGEICNRSKDGDLYWVDSVITPLHNTDGQIDRFVSIRSDITKRKKQENELRKSNMLLDRTGQIAGVGGWELDLDTRSVYWSNEMCKLHGVEPGYQPSFDETINCYAPEARDIVRKTLKKCIKSGEGWDLELPFIRANKERITVRAVGSVEFLNGKAKRLTGAYQDISEQVRQRQAIHNANMRMSLATTSGNIGIWEYDVASNTFLWDARMYKLYGLPPTDARESYELWSSQIHPNDKEDIERALEFAIEGRSSFDTEFRIIWNDGSVRHIRATAVVESDANGNPEIVTGVNWDVTGLRNMTRQLEEQHELLEVTLDSIGDAVITTDAKGVTQWLNPVAQKMTGWTKEEAKGKPLTHIFNILNEETRLRTENPVTTCLSEGKIVGLANHTVLVSRTGEEFGIEDSAAPIRDKNGQILGVVLVFHDVTEQRRLSGEVTYRAKHDTLTGLVNRGEFELRLNRLLSDHQGERSNHALMYLDLDQFKLINDTCGHSVGDEALIQVSKLFNDVIRSRDTLARLGGDEFGVILEHCSEKQAQRVAQDICNKMEDFRFVYEDHRFRIGASIGLVAVDNRWPTAASLMQAADKSCFAAKEAGRNRVHVFSDSDLVMKMRHGEMQWTRRIESALDEDKFVLFAQSIHAITDNTAGIHAEVLVRMIDNDGNLTSPEAFFPAAERYHLASRIDRWVIKNTLQWLRSQDTTKFQQIEALCINLSGQSIGDRAFHDFTCELLQKLDRETRQKLCIEITETAAITNITDASLFIERLKKLGVCIALDDFGAGASSFGYLKNLDVDVLKIDGQFIQDLLTDPLDEAAVRCFVDVANVVGLKTVAEFVDHPEVLSRLKKLGIDYVQGFLLHKPESIENLLQDDKQNTKKFEIVC